MTQKPPFSWPLFLLGITLLGLLGLSVLYWLNPDLLAGAGAV